MKKAPQKHFCRVVFSGGLGNLGAFVRRVTGSPFGHVVLVHAGFVLNPTFDGDLLHPVEPYLWLTPKLRCFFTVPLLRHLPPLEPRDHDRSKARTAMAWSARALGVPGPAADNCATRVAQVLREAGHTPPTLITPAELHAWLTQRGFPHEDFAGSGPPDSPARAGCPGGRAEGPALP